ncbi:phospholipase DDHD1 isoform X2 [Lates japonicus]|uniref:Phospholipase DDHD1 isoform X2 n=1 Tax=Lates japonicus TaxID=270547 RepID=A0AAD3RK13_LATJO|nr:phospholipase DDHD1 isoform X2 [Lates japonicus]
MIRAIACYVLSHLPPFYLPFLFKWSGYQTSAKTTCHKRKRCQAVHSLKLSRTHVDWHSVDEVYLYSDATTSKIARTVTQKLGFSKASSSGTRLHRGYVEEASPEDRPPQTTHIVFVVHGIGQKMDQGRIIKNTGIYCLATAPQLRPAKQGGIVASAWGITLEEGLDLAGCPMKGTFRPAHGCKNGWRTFLHGLTSGGVLNLRGIMITSCHQDHILPTTPPSALGSSMSSIPQTLWMALGQDPDARWLLCRQDVELKMHMLRPPGTMWLRVTEIHYRRSLANSWRN